MKKLSDTPDKLSKEEFKHIIENRNVRVKLAQKDPYWFFHIYFSEYIQYPTAPFQKQLFKDLANEAIRQLVVVSFRGSAKSTIATMAYPLWSIIGVQEKKFIVIASQTKTLAQQHLRNIRDEVESNALFRADFGPLETESTEWGIDALYIPGLRAKIIAVSRSQSIRGIRHGARRPDVVICDDIEDTDSVKEQKSRRDTDNWFNSEIKGIGDHSTKFVVVGNLLHQDSLVMRLKESILSGQFDNQKYSEYPIVASGRALWPGKYPDEAALELRRQDFNHITWMREFMLKIIPEEDQVVTLEMIQRYDSIPPLLKGETERRFIGVDLAISTKTSADYTAIVTVIARNIGTDRLKIYVLPFPINERLSFASTIAKLKAMRRLHSKATFVIETTGYQDAVAQTMRESGAKIAGIKPGTGKRERLNIAAAKIEQKVILFPNKGCETLVTQLTKFGTEKHDDLLDALTMIIIHITNLGDDKPKRAVFRGNRGHGGMGGSSGMTLKYRTQNGNTYTMHDPHGW